MFIGILPLVARRSSSPRPVGIQDNLPQPVKEFVKLNFALQN
jgi:hypothetical protein